MRALLLTFVVACAEAAQPTASPQGDEVVALRSEVRVLAGAAPDAVLPLVVALHGRGSDPDRFAGFFDGATTPARLLLVEAPVEEGNGRAWFSFRGKSRAELTAEMRALARRIVRSTRDAVQRHPTVGRPIITGFSQGAMLVYVLALEHPDVFERAVPVSGACFDSFVPSDASRATPLIVLHGENDPVISMSSGTRNVETLRRRGANVELRTFPEVRHWIAGDMKIALHEIVGIR